MATPTPDWWQAVSPYLDEALELSEREREVWLASLRSRDEPLARRLERLLREHGALAREGFLLGSRRFIATRRASTSALAITTALMPSKQPARIADPH